METQYKILLGYLALLYYHNFEADLLASSLSESCNNWICSFKA